MRTAPVGTGLARDVPVLIRQTVIAVALLAGTAAGVAPALMGPARTHASSPSSPQSRRPATPPTPVSAPVLITATARAPARPAPVEPPDPPDPAPGDAPHARIGARPDHGHGSRRASAGHAIHGRG